LNLYQILLIFSMPVQKFALMSVSRFVATILKMYIQRHALSLDHIFILHTNSG
jgi:hypothetical protein